MQTNQLVFELIMNIGLMVLVASLLSKLQLVQDIIIQEKRGFKSQTLLAVMFGAIIILSTYTGIDIGSYSLNTRVIGAMAAGLLGGPLVGLYASMIGAIYVYLFSAPQAFAMASAFSTVLFGLLGGGFYPYFQRGKWKYKDLFLLACFAEVCDMVSLLRFTVPVQMALKTILEISGPMILLNAGGILIFISSFNNIFIRQDLESSRQLQRASELSKRCLPLFVKGLHKGDDMEELASILLEETDWAGVMVTDASSILEWKAKEVEYQPEDDAIPPVGAEAIGTGKVAAVSQVSKDSPYYEWMKNYSMIAAPFIIRDKPIGCLIVWIKKKWVLRQSEMELLQHLVTIASFQIAMAELEHQNTMRQKAEFKALQFQVNPHFLFNALNTISCVCRENPERARQLLVTLANYFRYNLDYEAYMVPMEEEMDHVRDYLELEKARFEDKLVVTYDTPRRMDIRIPTLILQPIVENAVRHGIDRQGRRIVHIKIEEAQDAFIVQVCDRGQGFKPEVLKKLEDGEPIGKSIGLSNVHKRMKSTYGEDGGLKIDSSPEGSCVELRFKKGIVKENIYEDRSD